MFAMKVYNYERCSFKSKFIMFAQQKVNTFLIYPFMRHWVSLQSSILAYIYVDFTKHYHATDGGTNLYQEKE